MSIWATLPVDVQPSLSLMDWMVYELPDGDRHLVGFCPENAEGRVSSRISLFDKSAMCAVTGSGRVYKLVGKPGNSFHSDAHYTWQRWCKMWGVEGYEDVSGEYLEDL